MDEFVRSLQRDRIPEWSQQYLAYQDLQEQVEAAAAEDQDDKSRDQRQKRVEASLEREIGKILSFYQKSVDSIQQDLQQLRESYRNIQYCMSDQQTHEQDRLQQVDGQIFKLQQTGEQTSNLLQYVSLNVRGIRKVLNNFDRNCNLQKPKDGCIALEVDRPHHPGSSTFQGTSLPKETAQQLDQMFEHATLESAANTIKSQHQQLCQWQQTLQKHTGQEGQQARVSAAQIQHQMQEIIHRLDRSEYWAERNTDLIHTITKNERWAGIYEEAPGGESATGGLAGLAINCACAALYMANYQLILPDIETYLEHIGSDSSWAGIVIGCCDVATLPGALGYSLWTNRSFKTPLLAASLACIAGNLLYVMGYDAKTLWILLASRLMVGFGSARTVNRRYIADFISKEDRTKASAAFVTSSAVGMACGPLLALPLSYLPEASLGPISIDPVTAGAWVMGVFWVIYLLLTLILFKEPKSVSTNEHARNDSRDEDQPLMNLSDRQSDQEEGQAQQSKQSSEQGDDGDQHQLAPTILMFCVLFLVKLVQQGFLSSLSTFTSQLYGWSSSQSGLTLAVYGFSLIPLNLAVGKASDRVSDRAFSAVLLGIIGLGSAFCVCSGRPMWLFFLGGAFVFMGSMTLEGSAMSLLSKVMPPNLAKGTFNTGLLTTEAGGIGRLAGNLANSAFSKLAGLSGGSSPSQVLTFGRYLFGLLTLLTAGNAAYFGSMWSRVGDSP